MDVFIKSFNRPYYLERCLRSIKFHVKGDYNVAVLDDGTPSRYLEKIQQLFPYVSIHRSEAYEEKKAAIVAHLEGKKAFDQREMPSQFWKAHIESGSNIFLLLEEDAWFTAPIDLEKITDVIERQNLLTVKLFWCKNEHIIKGDKVELENDVQVITPQLPVENYTLGRILLTDKWRLKSILIRAGILDSTFFLPYYALYTVSSCFFQKTYWLKVWDKAGPKVNEGTQLANALYWKSLHQGGYGKSVTEKVNTSYITSSINPFRIIDFDFIRFNHQMNEAWVKGELDCMHNFPHDFSAPYLSKFINESSANCSRERWNQWIDLFKQQYRKTGCVID
jgi:hypothetical protein